MSGGVKVIIIGNFYKIKYNYSNRVYEVAGFVYENKNQKELLVYKNDYTSMPIDNAQIIDIVSIIPEMKYLTENFKIALAENKITMTRKEC